MSSNGAIPVICATIGKRRRIQVEDVRALRKFVYHDAAIDRDEAEAIFELAAANYPDCPEWRALFADVMADWLVNQNEPEGFVSEEKADWLVERIGRAGRVASAAELEMLVMTLEKARLAPSGLVRFAIAQIRQCVASGVGPLRAGSASPGMIAPADLVEDRRIVDGRRHGPGSPSAIFFIVPRRILPERVFGSRGTTMASLKAATGPILSRTSATSSFSISAAMRVTPAFSTTKPQAPALQLVGDADHGAFGDVRMGGEHLLHAAGRQAVAGDVDDVVGAAHDVEIAVLVDEAGIGGLVVAGEVGEVAFAEALVGVPQRRQAAGRQRQLDDDGADLLARHGLGRLVEHDLHVVARHRHGRRAVLDRQHAEADGLPTMAQPVSVCHQWSITGTPSCSRPI
jgi:hypothetical protein